MSSNNSNESVNHENQDPKEVLRYYKKRLEDLKNSQGHTHTVNLTLLLRTYIEKLDLSEMTLRQLTLDIKTLQGQALNAQAFRGAMSKETLGYVNDAYDKLIYLLDTLVTSSEPIGQRTDQILVIKKNDSSGFLNKIKNLMKSESGSKTLSNTKDFETLEVESSRDRYKFKIQVFISHIFSEDDIELAKILKNLLEERGIYGYIAEVRPEYELPLDKKIQKEITDAHYVVGIITHNSQFSSSVNQELGYALGKDISLILMVEKNVKHGVLTTPREIQEFTPDNFTQVCKRVIDYILERDIPKKISDEEKKWLIENVYTTLYNNIMNVYLRRLFLEEVPPNLWNDLPHASRLRVEPEIKEAFEEYSSEREKWSFMFVEWNTNVSRQVTELSKVIAPAFEKCSLLNPNGTIKLPRGQNIAVDSWLDIFKFVLLDPSVNNLESLIDKLLKLSASKGSWIENSLRNFIANTDVFRDLLHYLPELREAFKTEISYEELSKQRQVMVSSIERVTSLLEEKLKRK